MPSSSSPGVSMERSRSTPYSEYVQQQQRILAGVHKVEVPGGKKLWRQMVIGLLACALFGLVLFLLGSIYIKEAIERQFSLTIMLCVLGMVCGVIIMVGTVIMGKLFISRKWRVQEGQQPPRRPPEQCFNTCSIIYTPSEDQLASVEQPPTYEMAVLNRQRPVSRTPSSEALRVETHSPSGPATAVVLSPPSYTVSLSPPEYCVAAAPLPKYGDPV